MELQWMCMILFTFFHLNSTTNYDLLSHSIILDKNANSPTRKNFRNSFCVVILLFGIINQNLIE